MFVPSKLHPNMARTAAGWFTHSLTHSLTWSLSWLFARRLILFTHTHSHSHELFLSHVGLNVTHQLACRARMCAQLGRLAIRLMRRAEFWIAEIFLPQSRPSQWLAISQALSVHFTVGDQKELDSTCTTSGLLIRWWFQLYFGRGWFIFRIY